jgi:hypothetical protein
MGAVGEWEKARAHMHPLPLDLLFSLAFEIVLGSFLFGNE